jgi:hypothetical protein
VSLDERGDGRELLLDPAWIRFLQRDVEKRAGISDSGCAAHRVLVESKRVTVAESDNNVVASR